METPFLGTIVKKVFKEFYKNVQKRFTRIKDMWTFLCNKLTEEAEIVAFLIVNRSSYFIGGPIGARTPDLFPLLTHLLDAPDWTS